jgi:hypothetical protein
VPVQLPGVRDLLHVHMLHVRKPGELGNDWRRVPLSVRLGKAEGRNTSVYASEQSDRPIGPEKPPNKGSSTRDILATDLRRWWRKGA